MRKIEYLLIILLHYGQRQAQLNVCCHTSTTQLHISKITTKGRRRNEVMEMIKDMPESSYELLLKDIVDYHQNIEEEEESKVKHKVENRKIPEKNKNIKRVKYAGARACDVFLLKTFLPVLLSSKKKSNARNQNKICSGPSFEVSAKRVSKKWWKMILLAVKDNRSARNVERSTSDISINRTSYSFRNLCF